MKLQDSPPPPPPPPPPRLSTATQSAILAVCAFLSPAAVAAALAVVAVGVWRALEQVSTGEARTQLPQFVCLFFTSPAQRKTPKKKPRTIFIRPVGFIYIFKLWVPAAGEGEQTHLQ